MGHTTRMASRFRRSARTIRSQNPSDITVDIAQIDVSGETMLVDVFVSTDTTDTIDYELNINDTGTGGTVTRTGTLAGGAGSFPGDARTESVTFGVGDVEGGLVTAQITAPDAYVGAQDQMEWGDRTGGGGGGGSGGGSGDSPTVVNSCSSEALSSGDLDVQYSLVPESGRTGRDATVTVRVDGQEVGSATHFVPGRGGGFSQTIPASQLPIGEDMSVEVGINGDFRDCGTVSVADPDAAPEPEQAGVRLTGCEVVSEDPLQARFTLDGDGSRGSATVRLMVGGQQVASEQVDYTPNPVDRVIEAPASDLPVGEDMPVSVSAQESISGSEIIQDPDTDVPLTTISDLWVSDVYAAPADEIVGALQPQLVVEVSTRGSGGRKRVDPVSVSASTGGSAEDLIQTKPGETLTSTYAFPLGSRSGTVAVELLEESITASEEFDLAPRIIDCSIQSYAPLQVQYSVDGNGLSGDSTVNLRVGGANVASETIQHSRGVSRGVIEAPQDSLPIGEDLGVAVEIEPARSQSSLR